MTLFEFIKPATMTLLQEQVVANGTCPKCHKRTLRFVHSCEHFSSWQCTGCQHVYMLEPTLGKRDE